MMKKYMMIGCFFLSFYSHFIISFKLGLENISSQCIQHKKKPFVVGLITNQTGVDQQNTRNVDFLLQKNICTIKYIFVPEHGLNGVAAERDVHDSVDVVTKIPIVSLYKNGTGRMISSHHMKHIDALIFDIQDSGMRHYTYISTLLQCMKIAAEYKKLFIVLDRPNPVGGLMQGPLVSADLISFISIAPIPLRHGMTMGELALYFNKYILEKPTKLQVVPMSDYDRTQGFVGALHHQLSPNLRSLQSCIGYSFLGLLGEIEPFDVGVGTEMAFRCIMLPEVMDVQPILWKKLRTLLQSYGVKSFVYKCDNVRTKKKTVGLRLEFDNANDLRSFELFIDVMLLFKQYDIVFSCSSSFDKAVGSKKVQDIIFGRVSKDLFLEKIEKDVRLFKARAQKLFLYTPFPTS